MTSYRYEAKDVTETVVGNERIITCKVRLATLPLAPSANNIRTVDMSRPAVKAMFAQLLTEPDGRRFEIINMGGKMQAAKAVRREIEKNLEEITVYCDEEDGNNKHGFSQGNHTQHTATTAQGDVEKYKGLSKAWMSLTIITGSDAAQALSTAIGGNLMTAQQQSDQLLAAGKFNRLLKHMPENVLAVTQIKLGDKDSSKAPYTMTEIVRRVALWADSAFPLEQNQHPAPCYASPGGILTRFGRGEFDDVVPQVGNIMWFCEQAQNLVVEQNGLEKNGKIGKILSAGASARRSGKTRDTTEPQIMVTGEISDRTVSDVWVFPVVAPFRFWASGGGRSDMLISRDVLWKKYGKATLRALWKNQQNGYNKHITLNEWCKKPDTWAEAADPIRVQLIADGHIKNHLLDE